MDFDPVFRLPPDKARRERVKKSLERIVEQGRSVRDDLTSSEGESHVQRMIDDMVHAINSLSSDMSPEKAIAAIARIEYIRTRLSEWISKIDAGKLAAERLSSKFKNIGELP